VEPGASTEADPLSVLRGLPIPPTASIAIGPEGGWTETEWQIARARGVRLMTLGSRTLRADAVPVAAISVLQFLWGDL
jgi:16S rRNA (uracil1498-N3)-methyltransferase